MGKLSRVAAIVLLASVPAIVLAAQRISVGPVRGDLRAAISGQLAVALCPVRECVLWKRVSTRGRPDFQKARRLRVDGILVGAVGRREGQRVAVLELLRGSSRPSRTWVIALDPEGLLAPEGVREVSIDLARLAMEGVPPPAASRRETAPPAPLAPPRAAAPPPTEPAPPPPSPPPTAGAPAREEAPRPMPSPPPRAKPPARAASPAGRAHPIVALEAGPLVVRRELAFQGVSTGTGVLRGHEAPAMAGAFVRLDLFPAAAFSRGPLAGAGLFAAYRRSLGAETENPAGVGKVPTDLSRLGAGVLWRSPALGAPRIVLSPSASWQSLELSLSPAIAGLPDARLSGLRGALDVEVPLGSRLVLLLGGGYVWWLQAEDLIEGTVPFFPGGSASAIEGEAGLSVRIGGPLSVRLVAEASRTRYALDQDSTGVYAASGATDLYLAARLTVAVRY